MGYCGHGDEPSDSINGGEFSKVLERLGASYLITKMKNDKLLTHQE
jgi:hypothetical protein